MSYSRCRSHSLQFLGGGVEVMNGFWDSNTRRIRLKMEVSILNGKSLYFVSSHKRGIVLELQ